MKISFLRFSFLFLFFSSIFFGCTKDSLSTGHDALQKITLDPNGCYIGAFVDGIENIGGYENSMARRLAMVMWYIDFTKDFPRSDADSVIKHGSIPCITWEPWKADTDADKYNYFPLKNIASGSFDAYIKSWAASARNFKYPVLLRFAHEMNGSWYPWDGAHNNQSGEDYIAAWRHVHEIFKDEGAKNVTWIWNVNSESVPNENWNSIDKYYPGDSYVDFTAIDGFNFGTSSASKSWRSFDSIFLSMYNTLKTDYPGKTVMIGEMACSEIGGSKSEWILDAFLKIKNSYPHIRFYNWFNINKETDWRISSSTGSQNAFKKAMEDSYFIEKIQIQ